MSSIYKNSANLPHLHVPTLQQTAEKYLKAIRPFVNENELVDSEKLVDKLISEEGIQLQELLIKKAENTENWLAGWWKIRYLERRRKLQALSPVGLFPFEHFENDMEWLQYTAKLIVGVLNFKLDIDK